MTRARGKLTMMILLFLFAAIASGEDKVFLSFDRSTLPPNMAQHDSMAQMISHRGGHAMKVDFQKVDWPNVYFTPESGKWDWSKFAGINVDIFNPGGEPVDVCMRVDNEGADGATHCNTGSASVPPGQRATLQVRFNVGSRDFWGMRGIPFQGPVGHGPVIDTSAIVAFQVFLPRPTKPRTLILEEVRLFGDGTPLAERCPMPFVNAFGQFKHAKWPGKLKNEQEFAQRLRAEQRRYKSHPQLPERDDFGGWADGPRLKSGKWFRTEKVNGKWWLVTPSGHLFFSTGIDCVGTWEQTFIEGREQWFEWLPAADDPQYKDFFGFGKGAHSMAEPIGGQGRTFSFYRANLFRKYGPDWANAWRDMTYRRLQAWGVNTIANWSQEDVLLNSPMPFVASTGIWGKVRDIEGAAGYWGRMKDVYDPRFEDAVDKCVAAMTEKYARNQLCIGYFCDNELSWETIRTGVLASPADQPARSRFIIWLRAKYATIAALNKAWETDAADWDALRVPATPNAACTADLDELEYLFARRYFDTVNTALKKHAPNQLYLGCRFSSAPKMAVRACADVADVVSFNLYMRKIDADRFTGMNDLGKPLIIGEFHFGALDRGMFHTGLVATKNQKDRAKHYAEYVRAVADCPAFVGCHWFQYIDEPITGRWFDGENYNIGFVDVTDTPYRELVKAAQKVHKELYQRRYEGR